MKRGITTFPGKRERRGGFSRNSGATRPTVHSMNRWRPLRTGPQSLGRVCFKQFHAKSQEETANKKDEKYLSSRAQREIVYFPKSMKGGDPKRGDQKKTSAEGLSWGELGGRGASFTFLCRTSPMPPTMQSLIPARAVRKGSQVKRTSTKRMWGGRKTQASKQSKQLVRPEQEDYW